MINIFKSTKAFLIGLIIFFSCSLPMLGGKPKIEKVTTTMRPLSGKEAEELIKKKPDIFTFCLGGLAKDSQLTRELSKFKNDLDFLTRDLGIIEFRSPFLLRLFPKADFFRVNKIDTKPHFPFLIAIIGNKLYQMPYSFNDLLLEHNLEINDKNIIELAKAFVIIALEGKEITLLEKRKIREERMIGKKKNVTFTAIFKVKVGDEIWYWYLPQDIYEKGQFGGATLNDKDNKVVKIFQLVVIETK